MAKRDKRIAIDTFSGKEYTAPTWMRKDEYIDPFDGGKVKRKKTL